MTRPPIVAILGHVDHGKSTLLQTLKKIKITDQEPGGITQSIGAYQLKLPKKPGGKCQTSITFIDTPGHEAFAKMRSRGADVADIALLVIAADDGVKPQTLEALAHIKSAQIPFIVAINKIDIADANSDQVKAQLAEHEVAVEGYGGTVPVVEISAKEGTNLDELLEMISLVYDLSCESSSALEETKGGNWAGLLAPVIESKLDPQAGPLVNVIIKQGSLTVGDRVLAGNAEAKVKALIDEDGQRVKKLNAGEPAQILGFKKIIPVGTVVRADSQSGKVAQLPPDTSLPSDSEGRPVTPARSAGGRGDTFILKADSQGTLQALEDSLPSESEGRPADRNIISASIGKINESDVLLARSTSATIIGFRVEPSKFAARLAETEQVLIITDKVIYRLLEKLDRLQDEKLVPQEQETGRAKVVKVFSIDQKNIAGCKVETGKLIVGDQVRLVQGDRLIAESRIKHLKHRSQDIKEVKAGEECGVLLEGEKLKISEGQAIISFGNTK